MQDQSTRCRTYAWCLARLEGHDEHDGIIYTPASQSGPYRPNLTVGAGLTVADDGSEPRIFIHIDDQENVDEDAHMTVDEAVDLVDALISAISHAREVEQRD